MHYVVSSYIEVWFYRKVVAALTEIFTTLGKCLMKVKLAWTEVWPKVSKMVRNWPVACCYSHLCIYTLVNCTTK